MVKLRIDNDYSYLISDDTELKRKLWKLLRFREKGYIFSRLYRQRLWDGFRDFFTIANGKFLTGLLPEIMGFLKYLNIQFEIEDKRNEFKFLYENIDEKFLSDRLNTNIVLYDYQVDLINQIIKNKRGIVEAPTGAGKTQILLGTILSLPPKCPTLILVNNKNLANQNYESLADVGIENVGRLFDKYQDPNIITVATIQSTHKISKILNRIKALIVDEIQDNMSARCIWCYKKLTSCPVRVAISATPFKDGGKDECQKYNVKGYFGPIFKIKVPDAKNGVLHTKTLQDRNILSPSICRFYPIDEPVLPYAIYQDAVTYGIAENLFLHQVVKRLVEKLKGRTLILVDRLSHGDALNELIPNSLWIQGKDDLQARKHVIQELQKSQDDVVAIATKIFNAGTNVFIHNLISVADFKADHNIIQKLGRGLRTAHDKGKLEYYDFIFNNNEYLYRHSMKRVKILREQGHEVIIEPKIDF